MSYLEQTEGSDDVVGHVEVVSYAGLVQGRQLQGHKHLEVKVSQRSINQ